MPKLRHNKKHNNNKQLKETMTNKGKQVLKQVRSLAKQNQFVEAKNLLNKHSHICDVDYEFWNVYQGLGILYANKITTNNA